MPWDVKNRVLYQSIMQALVRRPTVLMRVPVRPVLIPVVRHVGPAPLRVHHVLMDPTTAYLISKSILLFTLFFCTMNWAHYRALRPKDKDNDDE
jgi:hypothetical protein